MKNTKPVPTQIKILRGTYRKDRDSQGMEIQPITQIPKPPDYFSENQINTWNVTCRTLLDNGLLQEVGIQLITIYCEQLEIYRLANIEVETKGIIIEQVMEYGTLHKVNPAHQLMNTAFKNIMVIADKFGFTPLSQSKIKGLERSGHGDIDDEFGF